MGAVLALLLALAPGPAAPREPDRPAFSRSRWIADLAARGVRFSGGVLPADRRTLAALLATVEKGAFPAPEAGAEARAPGKAAGANRAVRVSGDVLGVDAAEEAGAQAETQAEPFLAIDPEREARLLAGYQEGRFSDGGARALTYAVSEDGGRRWHEGLVAGLTPVTGGSYERASDPWVAFGPDGRAYYAALVFDQSTPRNGIVVSASADGGRTWGDPVTVHLGGNDFDDKEAMVVDTRDDSPFRGRVYVAWDSVSNSGQQTLRVASSDDGGLSFGPAVSILTAATAVGAIPLVGPGGVLHVIFLHFASSSGPIFAPTVAAVRSEDGGATWGPVVVVSESLAVGVPNLRTGALPAAAVDPATGQLAVVWQDARFGFVDQVLLSLSSDGGATWSEPRRVSEGPSDAPSFTPAVAYNGRGGLAVTYYTLRHDPARRFLVDEYAVVSRNRGGRFRRPVRLSQRSWDVRFAAIAGGFFLGDYQGLAAGRQVFHPFWIATFDRSRRDRAQRQPDAFTRLLQP